MKKIGTQQTINEDISELDRWISTTYLDLLTPVKEVACGKYNTLILINGKLYSVGD